MKTLIITGFTPEVAITFNSDEEFKVIVNKVLEDEFAECMGYLRVDDLENGGKDVIFTPDSEMPDDEGYEITTQVVRAVEAKGYTMDDLNPPVELTPEMAYKARMDKLIRAQAYLLERDVYTKIENDTLYAIIGDVEVELAEYEINWNATEYDKMHAPGEPDEGSFMTKEERIATGNATEEDRTGFVPERSYTTYEVKISNISDPNGKDIDLKGIVVANKQELIDRIRREL